MLRDFYQYVEGIVHVPWEPLRGRMRASNICDPKIDQLGKSEKTESIDSLEGHHESKIQASQLGKFEGIEVRNSVVLKLVIRYGKSRMDFEVDKGISAGSYDLV
jgi:hypothetical protein